MGRSMGYIWVSGKPNASLLETLSRINSIGQFLHHSCSLTHKIPFCGFITCEYSFHLGYMGHSHVTLCVLEKLSDGYNIKSIKQKQCVDGLLYMLQEFYGIENKENKQGEVRS